MSAHRLKRPYTARIARFLPHVLRDRQGTGAIEFALIAPLLILLYMGSFELSLGFTMSRKVAQATSTIADLTAQRSEIDAATLDSLKTVIERTLAPLGGNSYTMRISGISVAANGSAMIAWSRDETGARPYAPGTRVNLPTGLANSTTFLVRAEVTAPYSLWLLQPSGPGSATSINLSKTYYFRQRVGEAITCKNC